MSCEQQRAHAHVTALVFTCSPHFKWGFSWAIFLQHETQFEDHQAWIHYYQQLWWMMGYDYSYCLILSHTSSIGLFAIYNTALRQTLGTRTIIVFTVNDICLFGMEWGKSFQ